MIQERLQKLRQAKNLTQVELARRVGISKHLYNKYERAGVRPPDETLILLARELGVTFEHLAIGTINVSILPEKEKAPINDEDLKVAFWGKPDISDKQLDKLRKLAKILEDDDNDGN